MNPSRALLLGLFLSGCSCLYTYDVPDGAVLTCEAQRDCPAGFACKAFGVCVRLGTGDDTPPVISMASVTPTRGKNSTTFTASFEVDEPLFAPPVVSAALVQVGTVATFTFADAGTDGLHFTYAWTAADAGTDTVAQLLVRAVDVSANAGSLMELVYFTLDVTPPELVGAGSVLVRPPPDSVLATVDTATIDAGISIAFAVTEPLGPDPLLVLDSSGLSFDPPVEFSPRAWRVEGFVREATDGGARSISVALQDVAGNARTVPLGAVLNIDTEPPVAPDTVTPGRVLLRRWPWGSATSATRRFSVEGADLATGGGELVRVFPSTDDGGIDELPIGQGLATPSGAFGPLNLPQIEPPEVYVRAYDPAGNASPPAKVHDVEWLATPRAIGSNPHQLLGRRVHSLQLTLDDDKSTAAALGAAITGGWSWRERVRGGPQAIAAHAFDLARARIVVLDTSGGTWEWANGGWVSRASGFGPGPRTRAEAVYDPSRGVTVLYGGVGTDTHVVWEWNGALQSWSQHDVPGGPADGGGTLSYDPVTSTTVVHFNQRLYRWNGVQWLGAPVYVGGGCAGCPLLYDSVRSRLLQVDAGIDELQPDGSWSTFASGAGPIVPLRWNPRLGRPVSLCTGVRLCEWNGQAFELRGDAHDAGAPLLFAWDPAHDEGVIVFAPPSGGETRVISSAGVELRRVPHTVPWPLPRAAHASAVPDGGELVLNGGYQQLTVSGDTWRWNGETWLPTPDSAPPMWGHRMTVSPAGEVWMYGTGPGSATFTGVLNLDGGVEPRGNPGSALPLDSHAFFVVPGTTNLGTVGGRIDGDPNPAGTQFEDLGQWTYYPLAGPQRWGAAQVALPGGDVLVHAGATLNTDGGTRLNSSTVSRLRSGATPPVWVNLGSGPAPRMYHAMSYDAAARKILLFSGQGGPSTPWPPDTWVSSFLGDGGTSSWSVLPVADPEDDGAPALRHSHSLDYFAARRASTLFGGQTATGLAGDLWELAGADSRPAAVFTVDTSTALARGARVVQLDALAQAGCGGVSSAVDGCELYVWLEGAWEKVASTAFGLGDAGPLSWSLSTGADAGLTRDERLRLRNGSYTFAVVPLASNGTTAATVQLDYVELKLNLRLP